MGVGLLLAVGDLVDLGGVCQDDPVGQGLDELHQPLVAGGRLDDRLERPEPAEEGENALALWKGVAAMPGTSRGFAIDLADTHAELADVYAEMKAYPKAVAEMDQAIGLYVSSKDRGMLPKAAYSTIDEMKAQQEKYRRGQR